MNDKDFDKILGDKLREERSFSSKDKDWEQLTPRLDSATQTAANDKRRRGLAWLWLLLLPVLSLLLWQMYDIHQQNKQLTMQMAALQTELATHVLAHDTIVQIVQKTDTIIIYKEKAIIETNRKNRISKSLSNNRISPQIIETPSVKSGFLTKKTDVLPVDLPLITQESTTKQDTFTPNQLIDQQKMTELNEHLTALDKQITDLKRALSEGEINAARLIDCGTKQDSLKKQLAEAVLVLDSLKKHPLSTEPLKTDKSLKNNRLFIGLQGGKINYRTTWVNSLGIDLYKDIKSYQAGLKVEYAVTDKLRIIAEGDFCPFSFTNYWQNSRYNLPALQFDAQKEKFLKAEATQKLLQGNIGIKYLFTEGVSKWRPSISVAYTMMRINPFDTKFTYQSLWGTMREHTVQSSAVKLPNLLMLSGGLEYRFSKYGVAQAEAFYYKDVNKTHKTFDLFGLRAAILLNLK